jgi:pyruvyltransferase
MRHKLVKLIRRLRALPFQPGNLPVAWHIGSPNFGDDINPILWATVTNRPVRLVTRRFKAERLHALGIGSILDTATEHSVVFGSGLLCPEKGESIRPHRVLAVRGQLTADRLPVAAERLGDPAVLVDLLFPQPRKVKHAVGVIPHFTHVKQFQSLVNSGAYVIDPAWPPSAVLAAICRCERIFSQSLHGLIIADAFGVPNAWIDTIEPLKGGDFKFRDYYSTTDVAKVAIPFSRLRDAIAARSVDTFVSRFRFDKMSYLSAIRSAADDHFPIRHKAVA